MNGRILIVDDDLSTCKLLEKHLGDRGFTVVTTTKSADAFQILSEKDFDLVLTDLNMARVNGIDLCDRVVSNFPHIPVVVITAFGSLELAVEAIRVGAYDFITKPVDLDFLAHSIQRAIKHAQINEGIKKLPSYSNNFHNIKNEIVGESPTIHALNSLVYRAANNDLPVLMLGKSGSGKELVTKILHSQSKRRNKPFIVFNCSVISEQTLELDLFGKSSGAILQANGGTLFLREISQLPIPYQKDLERILAEGFIRIKNESSTIPIDVRIIASSSISLEELVNKNEFRQDLFDRISLITIPIPTLLERDNDVLILAQHFVKLFSRRHQKEVNGISSGVAAKLLQYDWPGNIRELKNIIERAVALTNHEKLVIDDLPDKIRRYYKSDFDITTNQQDSFLPMEEVEKQHILKVLQSIDGNKVLAAKILGLNRRTLYRKLERYGL